MGGESAAGNLGDGQVELIQLDCKGGLCARIWASHSQASSVLLPLRASWVLAALAFRYGCMQWSSCMGNLGSHSSLPRSRYQMCWRTMLLGFALCYTVGLGRASFEEYIHAVLYLSTERPKGDVARFNTEGILMSA